MKEHTHIIFYIVYCSIGTHQENHINTYSITGIHLKKVHTHLLLLISRLWSYLGNREEPSRAGPSRVQTELGEAGQSRGLGQAWLNTANHSQAQYSGAVWEKAAQCNTLPFSAFVPHCFSLSWTQGREMLVCRECSPSCLCFGEAVWH